MRMLKRLAHSEITRARNAALSQYRFALIGRSSRSPFLEHRHERRPISSSAFRVAETRIIHPFRMPHRAGQSLEVILLDRRYHYIAVFRAGRLKSIGALFLRKLRLRKLVDEHAEHAVHHRVSGGAVTAEKARQ